MQNLTPALLEEAARASGLEPEVIAAVAEVESGGRFFAQVKGRGEPLIRFEGHYFDRRLSGEDRARARAEGLADPRAGAVKNPASQAARWAMLARASAINRAAALESVSWGCGQVMGAHWKALGYDSAEALAAEARSGASGQIALMLRFITQQDLAKHLKARDWAAFARAYNGPGYRKNAYDRKLAEAYARLTDGPRAARPAAPPALAEDIVLLQRQLAELGHELAIDGIFGPETRMALRRFQAANGLAADGIAGPKTRAALQTALASRGNGPMRLLARFFRWLFGLG